MSKYKKSNNFKKKAPKNIGGNKFLSHLSKIGKKIKDFFSSSTTKKTPDKNAFKKRKSKSNKEEDTTIYNGKINITSSGNAFAIIKELKKDIFIPKEKTRRALEGDHVKIRVNNNKSQGKRTEGEVIKITKREKEEFAGIFEKKPLQEYGFVLINGIHVDIYVSKENSLDAKDKDRVLVKMLYWKPKSPNPVGEIIKVLGPCGEHEVEIKSILAEFKLPSKFPEEVEKETASISQSIPKEEIAKRKDMRASLTITIDPLDAKDFDDAISLEKLPNENWEIGVHIADVSHYVKEGSALDGEAYKRATSVYLVDRVVPMLPEILSNEICSLRPDEDKLCFSAVFEIDPKGMVLRSWFGRTIIRSKRRFTYEEAQIIIEEKEGEFSDAILTLNHLAKQLRKKRFANGSINFGSSEMKFKLDEKANPIEIYKKVSKEAHQMIEEFMLLANKKVSSFVSLNSNSKPSNRTYIYRIHEEPDKEKLELAKVFISSFGYELNLKTKESITSSINELLKNINGKAEQSIIESLIMRAMSKAKYSTYNVGHYGLAFDYYTHFTSPIRRYPDIIAHRLLDHYLKKGKKPSPISYEKKAEHCSIQERLAMEAERESIKYMQVKYMEAFVGQKLRGSISGITDWGMFVELIDSGAEGMIRLRDLKDDLYVFDKENYSLLGKNTKKSYKLGNQVEILVKEANLEKRQLNFELIN